MANPNPYFQYTVGLNNVGSYQASARPFMDTVVRENKQRNHKPNINNLIEDILS